MNRSKQVVACIAGMLMLLPWTVKSDTMELVIFNSKQGITPEQVIEAAHAMEDNLRSWPGFKHRSLVKMEAGQWLDVVHWTDMASALAAQERAMSSDVCLSFFALIESSDQHIYHGEIVMQQQP